MTLQLIEQFGQLRTQNGTLTLAQIEQWLAGATNAQKRQLATLAIIGEMHHDKNVSYITNEVQFDSMYVQTVPDRDLVSYIKVRQNFLENGIYFAQIANVDPDTIPIQPALRS